MSSLRPRPMFSDASRAKHESGAVVPFVDLEPMNSAVREPFMAALGELVDSGAFTNGPFVESFEEAFAEYCERNHCVGLSSGLDALRLGLAALGVGPGDEVIVPAMTFVATFEAVAQVGATPVPVDVRDDDVCLDPDATESAVTTRTKVILPVHLYGQMADVVALRALAQRHRLPILEDAAQAHGATRDGFRAGTAGTAAAFSFYPSKNLGAMGDAGALVTNDGAVADDVRALRQHGERDKYRSDAIGWTARLDALQALVLSLKLPLLESWNDQRQRVAASYREALAGVGDLRLPVEVSGARHVWHVFAVRTSDPDALSDHLRALGIATSRHYPEPPHLSRAFTSLGHAAGSFPIAEAVARETLSLPMYPGLGASQVERVTSAVREFFDGG